MGNDLYLVIDEAMRGCGNPDLVSSLCQAGARQVFLKGTDELFGVAIPNVRSLVRLTQDAGNNEDGVFAVLRVPPTAEEIASLLDVTERMPCRVYDPLLEEYITREAIDRTVEAEAKAMRRIAGLFGQVAPEARMPGP